jgi:hypothetical protein
MSKPNVQTTNPKDVGLRGLSLPQPVFAADVVDRADDALREMSGSFQEWLENEGKRLQVARLGAERAGWTSEAINPLLLAAHDLKGLGATYEYPITTQLAASLCRLIETEAGRAAVRANPDLAAAHVDAVRAAVRDKIKTSEHPVGRLLLSALEAQVEALGVAPR